MKVLFSERFRELRLERNLSRVELAKILQDNARTISYWELGQRECNFSQLCEISKFFNVSVDYLLGLED